MDNFNKRLEYLAGYVVVWFHASNDREKFSGVSAHAKLATTDWATATGWLLHPAICLQQKLEVYCLESNLASELAAFWNHYLVGAERQASKL